MCPHRTHCAPPPALWQQEDQQQAALESCRRDQYPQQHEKKRVKIPDLFVSFVSQKPKLNPYYEVVKKECEAQMKQYEDIHFQPRDRNAQKLADFTVRVCHWTEKEYKKHVHADFPYFAAMWTTEAGPDEYRTICDFLIWAFDFDDMCEDNEHDEHSENARKEIEALTAIMNSPNPIVYTPEQYPSRYIFQSIWQRVAKRSSPGAQRRFISSMENFFSGVVDQLDLESSATEPDIETYMAVRRKSIGAYPCLAMVEYFNALDLPDEVVAHHSIRKIATLAADICLLQNDVLSFHKEQSDDFNLNIIHLFRRDGLSQQEAYDQVNKLLNKRYQEWYLAHSEIPPWGEAVDVQVQMYLKGCQDLTLANVNWGFKTERYFGKEKAVVRRTRLVRMLT